MELPNAHQTGFNTQAHSGYFKMVAFNASYTGLTLYISKGLSAQGHLRPQHIKQYLEM